MEPPSPLPGCLGGGHPNHLGAEISWEYGCTSESRVAQNPIVYHHFQRNWITIFLDKRWVDVLFRQTIVCSPTMSWWQHEWEYNLTLFLRLIWYGWGPPGWDTIGLLVWSRFTVGLLLMESRYIAPQATLDGLGCALNSQRILRLLGCHRMPGCSGCWVTEWWLAARSARWSIFSNKAWENSSCLANMWDWPWFQDLHGALEQKSSRFFRGFDCEILSLPNLC